MILAHLFEAVWASNFPSTVPMNITNGKLIIPWEWGSHKVTTCSSIKLKEAVKSDPDDFLESQRKAINSVSVATN